MQNTFNIHTFVKPKMLKIKSLTYTQSILLIAILAALQFFFRLDKPVIREWDEGLYGVNALEMLQGSNPILVTFNGEPDFYNSKPPLGLWLMAGSIKVFGFNTFGIRFASAFISFLLVLFLFWFIYKTFHNLHWALFTALILLGSMGFTGWHEARSGDFDAMVAAFIFCYSILFLKAVYQENSKFLLYGSMVLSVACLCKGVYGLVAIPGILLTVILEKRIVWIFKQYNFYLGFLFFVTTFLGYYAWREAINPGYLAAVLQNEVGERILLETHIHKAPIPFYYHTFKLLVYRFQPFVMLLPFAVYFIFKLPKSKQSVYLKGAIYITLGIWFIISFSVTKLVWYDGSLYPFFALIMGWFLTQGLPAFAKWRSTIFMCLLLIFSVVFGLNQTEKDAFTFPHFLDQMRNEKQIKAPITVYAKSFEIPVWFYAKQEKINGRVLLFTYELNDLKAGQMVCTISAEQELELKAKFTLREIFKKGSDALFIVE